MKQSVEILWFKKNLRCYDNEMLSNINDEALTLGVYFFEPHIMNAPDFSDFHLCFIFQSLLELQKNLYSLNIPLLLLSYESIEGLEKIEEYFEITKIHNHEETGNWLSYMRDKKVIQYCKNQNISLREYPTNGVVRRLKSRDNWNALWQERMMQGIFLPKESERTIAIPSELCELSKKTKNYYQEYFREKKLSLQIGGESEGQKVLEDFLSLRSKNYMYQISKPLEGERGCSRLSPYITYGCISLKHIVHESYKKLEELKSLGTEEAKRHKKSLNFFLARIHWQSHFIQKLEDEPEMEFQNLQRTFDSIRNEADEALIEKVFSAQSGIPYIDSVMRQLQQTGWTNFRSRAIIVSFLCNTCMQPWQAIAPRLAGLFLDYEPGIHYPQIQMQAGTTGINTIRIYNPVYNGKQKDSDGKCIRKYLPELKDIPTKYIHEPHLWEGFSTLNYPEPIIDIKEANKYAKKILWEMKGHIPKEQKQSTLKKHGSRVFRGKKKAKKSEETSPQISLFQ